MVSPEIKKKRIIRVTHPQLRRFRTAMRELLKAAHNAEWWRLRGLSHSIEKDDYNFWMKEGKKIEEQIEGLDRALHRAPIGCRLCGHQDLDLVFNPHGSEWFCESCYTFNQEYYKKNPHPDGIHWKKLYP